MVEIFEDVDRQFAARAYAVTEQGGGHRAIGRLPDDFGQPGLAGAFEQKLTVSKSICNFSISHGKNFPKQLGMWY